VARRGENVADSQVLGLNVVKAQESLSAVAGGRVQNFDLRGKTRQMFATDLVNNGLPIHIGTALLGHLNIQTTRGYVAVFEEDLVRHYQEFLDHRRALRPTGEYRASTETEMAEFEEHFDKR
jgi:site-specific recombinase XerD